MLLHWLGTISFLLLNNVGVMSRIICIFSLVERFQLSVSIPKALSSSISSCCLLRVSQFRMKCSIFSSLFLHKKQLGSVSFLYILILLLCRMYEPVNSFNLIGNLVVSKDEWQLILKTGCIFPFSKCSYDKKLSPL